MSEQFISRRSRQTGGAPDKLPSVGDLLKSAKKPEFLQVF